VPQAALDDDLPLELLPLVARYVAQPEARPTPQDSARLLARLVAEEHALALAGPAARGRARTALRVARWRLRLLGPWFWIASVVLLLAGTALTHVVPSTQAAMPLILLLPLTAVLSLAHVVRTLSPGLRAVEASSPLGFVEVTSGLVLVLVGFDCALGVAATLVRRLARPAAADHGHILAHRPALGRAAGRRDRRRPLARARRSGQLAASYRVCGAVHAFAGRALAGAAPGGRGGGMSLAGARLPARPELDVPGWCIRASGRGDKQWLIW